MSTANSANPLLDSSQRHDAGELLAFFDTLEPIPAEFMLGQWRGEVLLSGHPGEPQLQGLNWVGKHFHSVNHVDPIISADASGARVVNPVLGTASLREVVFRGQPTATMVYDQHPVFDHFRKIDDERVLGVMDRKGDNALLFFCLQRLD
ncbi:DUF4334 domain-containing protein [Pseudomaricurvus sp. HS19]|uniref:DUF4334 domain-containing protein n=1 Tax=Pseudomaricurvus sp. HS19 TaxID=2692626 RepID=UPI001368B976|nr:DUF4334 domain-containing protein [Pseudomaricurvus sp. HS19]MYM63439.1 DUF4334 domain-containing protein [Pseudomaricurvus sp. HS19]